MMRFRYLRRFSGKALKQPAYAAHVLYKRLAARVNYMSAGGRSAMPESVTLFLTHRCNLQCKMCGQWGEGGVTKKAGDGRLDKELTIEQVRGLVDEVAASRPSITLFGGEPLLYAHCVEAIRHIKSRGLHCLVITNGSLLERMADGIVDSGLDELNISLDGGSALHDRIRGMDGLFARIMAGIKKVNALKAAGGKDKPLVNLQCTITRYNYKELEQMVDVAKEAKASSLTFHNLIFTTRKRIAEQRPYDEALGCSSADWEGFVFEPGIDPEALSRKVGRIMSGRYPFSVDLYPNFSPREMSRYYGAPSFVPSEYPARCLSPWLVAYVFPDGSVRPCLNCTYAFGNIIERPFREVWNSPAALRFRGALKKEKAFPLCNRCTELYRY